MLRFESLDDRLLLAALTIAQENQLPGAPESQWFYGGTASTNIEGYATQMSVDNGQTIQFKVNTKAAAYRLDIYRLGYYGGLGAREVASVQPSLYLPQGQPAPLIDSSAAHDSGSAGLVDAGNWLVTASWDVPEDATSGIYFAKLEREDGGSGTNYIIFVVRDDEGSSDLLFKTSDETWQAYNNWGNSSLYGPNAGNNGRSFKVSYNRPIVQAFDGPLDVFDQEHAMVSFLESNGYDVSYTSAIDVAMNASALLNHKVFLSVGHDEYWSGEERANIEAARDAGLSLAFFSGNEMFWKTRWESSLDNSRTPGRTLVCYKETHESAKIDPLSNTWTGTWRDPRFSPPADGGRPENAVTGVIFTVNFAGPSTTAIAVPAEFSRLRFWRNTSIATLAPGTTATLAQATLGGEWDEDLDNGFRPAGLFRMSSTTVALPAYIQDYGSTYGPGTATHSLTLYRASSGALVFGAGTDMWAYGLVGAVDSGDPYTPGKDIRIQQATVNLFADMGAQPTTLQSGLVGATASTDFTAPTSTIISPAEGAIVQAGIAITIRGTAQEAGGGVLTSVEVSVDDGLTWHRATGLSNWTYSWTPYTTGTVTIKSRAVDDSGNIEQPSAGITVGMAGTSVTMWGNTANPAVLDTADGQAIELGVKFTSDANGQITGLRFYKSTANTGTHTASLWTASGQRLATATFTNETARGWQQVNFANPIAVTAGTTYIASYHTNAGHYSASRNYFSSDFTSGPLHVPTGGGVFLYGASGFPTNTYMETNYWVDVVLKANPPMETIAPTVTAFSPANGASSVPTNATASVTFSEALNAATVNSSTVFLRNANNVVITATVVYNSSTNTVTLTPASGLAISTAYTIVVKGGSAGVKDLAGNALAADATSSFTTASSASTSSSLWPAAPIPEIIDSGDGLAVELGVKFTSSTSGYITGLRFYKSAANTGTHTASLWTSTGQLLATATFTNETASGWQQVSFADRVAIAAGATYVASYNTSVGHYAVSRPHFTSAYMSGPLQVPANGGVYLYGSGGFPVNTFQASNYWVDVEMVPGPAADTTAPTVTAFSPISGASSVPTNAAASVTFSEALNAATVNSSTVFLRNARNVVISATVAYNSSTNTVTLTPTSGLANSTIYTIVAKGGSAGVKDLAGNALAADATSSFTTASSASTSSSLWPAATVPDIIDSGDGLAVELGVKFSSNKNGTISGIRFYKSAANTGTHTASLWDSKGKLLASVTFTDETTEGWQQVNFAAPIAIKSGKTYVASYHTEVGHYSVTRSYFNSKYANGPLTVAAKGGVYRYGASGFPKSSYLATNYWVDVIFNS